MWVKQCHIPAIWEWFKSNLFIVKLGIIYGIVLPTLPSGKRLHNYGKSQFSMGKSSINGNFQ